MKPEDHSIQLSELRRRAQELLKKKPPKSASLREDIDTLEYELSTHKIALELQNEDLRNAQAELQKSRRRYADLYDFAPVAYLTVSYQGVILEANLTAADMLGVARRHLLNRLFSSFIVPEDKAEFYRRRQILLETGKQSYELRLHKQDGTTFHALVEAVTDPSHDDSPGQYRIIISDISSRKAAELARVRRLKERYWAIVQNQTELICRFDLQQRITFVNNAYCRYFGVEFKEALGTKFLPNIYEEDVPLFSNHFRDLNSLLCEQTIEFRVVLADGRMRWLQWSGRAQHDESDQIVEFQIAGRDITPLKAVEEELRKEAYLRQVFMDALPCIALLIERRSKKIVAANRAARAIGALPGQPCYLSFGKQDRPCSWCRAAETSESSQIQNRRYWNDEKYWDVYWVHVDERQYLHYAIDITEAERVSQALQRAHDELEQRVKERTRALERSHAQLIHSEKLAAIGNLSASIAHEFNNPLQGVMTVLKGLEQHTPLPETEKKLVSLAFQECLRMKNLIADLRDFHRPTSGRLELADIHAVLDTLLSILSNDFHTRSIRVQKKYGEHLPSVPVVVDQIKQVFLNLLTNAADACEEGGTITISTEKRDEYIIIHVEDTGTGIGPTIMSHIFEPFFTTKSELRGTGLGLSVSYGIVKDHNGRIDVESEPGKGAKFSVSLPVKGPWR